MRHPEQIKQAEQQWLKDKAAWTKDTEAKQAEKTIRPYDDSTIINSGESWKD